MTYAQRKILVVFTGGTIAGNVGANSVHNEIQTTASDFTNVLADSIETVKQNWNIEIAVDTCEVCFVDSSDMTPQLWEAIITAIEERYDEFDSFIVIHGTNTMGYTAAALSFAFENVNKPIIITGAQVPFGFLESDALTNLVNSLRLAVWEYHTIKGVMAVFGSKIISGVRVKKGTDFDYDPFSSFQTGALGQIGRFIKINTAALDKHISYLSRSRSLAIQSRALSVKKKFETHTIASLTEFPGMQPETFTHLVENAGCKGVILRAFGAGDASQNLFEGLHYLKENRVPIVITSQAPNGVANFQVNESGVMIREKDLAIPAFDMSMESMTTKLAWLLAQNKSYEEIKHEMVKDLHGEINVHNELI